MKFIYGKEEYLIKQEIKKFIKENKGEVINISEDETIENIILNFSTISLFKTNKLFVISNHDMFYKNHDIDDFLIILKTLKKHKVIFSLNIDKLNKKNQLISFLLKNAECKEFKSITQKELISTINKIVDSKNGTIENGAAIKLSSKLPLDLRIIILEIEKLLLENNHITIKMVNRSIDYYVKEDAFALSNALTQKDSHGIINSYKNKKKNGEETSLIISQISSILSLSILISFYRKKGFNNKRIQEEIGIHVFRIQKAGELISFSSIQNIKNLIKELANLENNIKMGKVEPINGMEIFLLHFIR